MDAESDGKRPSRAAAKCAEKKISKQVQEHINYESVQEETLNLKKERKKDPTVKVNVKKKVEKKRKRESEDELNAENDDGPTAPPQPQLVAAQPLPGRSISLTTYRDAITSPYRLPMYATPVNHRQIDVSDQLAATIQHSLNFGDLNERRQNFDRRALTFGSISMTVAPQDSSANFIYVILEMAEIVNAELKTAFESLKSFQKTGHTRNIAHFTANSLPEHLLEMPQLAKFRSERKPRQSDLGNFIHAHRTTIGTNWQMFAQIMRQIDRDCQTAIGGDVECVDNYLDSIQREAHSQIDDTLSIEEQPEQMAVEYEDAVEDPKSLDRDAAQSDLNIETMEQRVWRDMMSDLAPSQLDEIRQEIVSVNTASYVGVDSEDEIKQRLPSWNLMSKNQRKKIKKQHKKAQRNPAPHSQYSAGQRSTLPIVPENDAMEQDNGANEQPFEEGEERYGSGEEVSYEDQANGLHIPGDDEPPGDDPDGSDDDDDDNSSLSRSSSPDISSTASVSDSDEEQESTGSTAPAYIAAVDAARKHAKDVNRRERDKNVRAAMHPLMFNSINELSLRIKSKVKDIDALRYGFSQLAQLCMTFELSRTKSFEFGSGNNKFKLCQMYSSKKLESEYYKAAENSTVVCESIETVRSIIEERLCSIANTLGRLNAYDDSIIRDPQTHADTMACLYVSQSAPSTSAQNIAALVYMLHRKNLTNYVKAVLEAAIKKKDSRKREEDVASAVAMLSVQFTKVHKQQQGLGRYTAASITGRCARLYSVVKMFGLIRTDARLGTQFRTFITTTMKAQIRTKCADDDFFTRLEQHKAPMPVTLHHYIQRMAEVGVPMKDAGEMSKVALCMLMATSGVRESSINYWNSSIKATNFYQWRKTQVDKDIRSYKINKLPPNNSKTTYTYADGQYRRDTQLGEEDSQENPDLLEGDNEVENADLIIDGFTYPATPEEYEKLRNELKQGIEENQKVLKWKDIEFLRLPELKSWKMTVRLPYHKGMVETSKRQTFTLNSCETSSTFDATVAMMMHALARGVLKQKTLREIYDNDECNILNDYKELPVFTKQTQLDETMGSISQIIPNFTLDGAVREHIGSILNVPSSSVCPRSFRQGFAMRIILALRAVFPQTTKKHAVEHVKSFETWKSDAAHRYIGSTFNKRNMDQFSDDLVDGYLHDLGHATFRQHFVDLGLSEAVTAVVALALVQSYRLYAYDLVLPATNATRIDRGSSVTFGDQDDRLEIEAPLFRNFLEQYELQILNIITYQTDVIADNMFKREQEAQKKRDQRDREERRNAAAIEQQGDLGGGGPEEEEEEEEEEEGEGGGGGGGGGVGEEEDDEEVRHGDGSVVNREREQQQKAIEESAQRKRSEWECRSAALKDYLQDAVKTIAYECALNASAIMLNKSEKTCVEYFACFEKRLRHHCNNDDDQVAAAHSILKNNTVNMRREWTADMVKGNRLVVRADVARRTNDNYQDFGVDNNDQETQPALPANRPPVFNVQSQAMRASIALQYAANEEMEPQHHRAGNDYDHLSSEDDYGAYQRTHGRKRAKKGQKGGEITSKSQPVCKQDRTSKKKSARVRKTSSLNKGQSADSSDNDDIDSRSPDDSDLEHDNEHNDMGRASDRGSSSNTSTLRRSTRTRNNNPVYTDICFESNDNQLDEFINDDHVDLPSSGNMERRSRDSLDHDSRSPSPTHYGKKDRGGGSDEEVDEEEYVPTDENSSEESDEDDTDPHSSSSRSNSRDDDEAQNMQNEMNNLNNLIMNRNFMSKIRNAFERLIFRKVSNQVYQHLLKTDQFMSTLEKNFFDALPDQHSLHQNSVWYQLYRKIEPQLDKDRPRAKMMRVDPDVFDNDFLPTISSRTLVMFQTTKGGVCPFKICQGNAVARQPIRDEEDLIMHESIFHIPNMHKTHPCVCLHCVDDLDKEKDVDRLTYCQPMTRTKWLFHNRMHHHHDFFCCSVDPTISGSALKFHTERSPAHQKITGDPSSRKYCSPLPTWLRDRVSESMPLTRVESAHVHSIELSRVPEQLRSGRGATIGEEDTSNVPGCWGVCKRTDKLISKVVKGIHASGQLDSTILLLGIHLFTCFKNALSLSTCEPCMNQLKRMAEQLAKRESDKMESINLLKEQGEDLTMSQQEYEPPLDNASTVQQIVNKVEGLGQEFRSLRDQIEDVIRIKL